MKKYFTLDSSPLYPEKYVIRINSEEFPMPQGLTGSYALIEARLMNMNWPTFLRFLRDELGAEIIGKRSRYPAIYFDYTADVHSFLKLLNARMNYVMNEQKFPYEYTQLENGDVERTPFNEVKDESNT